MMRRFVEVTLASTAACLILFQGMGARAKSCDNFLEEMKTAQVEIESPHHGRQVASIEKDPAEAKQDRIKAMKEFLSVEDFAKQKALATVMVNFLLDKATGRRGDLAMGAALVNGDKVNLKSIRANDPRNPLHKYLRASRAGDVEDIKALTVYILRVKNLNVDAAKAKLFLESQLEKGNTHFRILDDHCVIDDPVFQKMAMN